MNTLQAQSHPFDSYVLKCWAHQAQLQRSAFEAFAAYLG
ncbi:hypothetical protein DFO68_13115 [Halomonas ventosae]|uniref:Uncharacterized protein n=1 Tax=Halomonas ventosae TaxID=229007 RepID=A0A4R6GQ73_9GAMM|nr:hypothetical protein DFO68_13115 [Halomonas ventosae]